MAFLRNLAADLVAAFTAETFDRAVPLRVGAALVDAHFTETAAIERTLALLGCELAARTPALAERLALLQGAVAAGYAGALQDRTRREQERRSASALAARAAAEQARWDSEARLQTRLRHQALHDPLTGLPNRTLFFERLDAALLGGAGPGVCYLDLDGFTEVNDTLGHDKGDALLRIVARHLTEALGGRHLVARMGGDEFVVLVERDADADTLRRVARAVLGAVRRPVRLDDHEVSVSASIGVVRAGGGQDAAELMKTADTALYWAKADGRNRYAMFDEARHRSDVDRFAVAARMPEALARGEFSLVYQPLVQLADRTAVGVEALVRWTLPGGRRLDPGRFVPLAEDSGFIVPLGRWVLDAGVPARRRVGRRGPGDAPAGQRERGGPAAARAVVRRRRRHRPRRDRVACRAAAARADGERADGHPGRFARRPARTGGHGGAHRHRRLRHRLFQLRLPAPVAGARAQAGRTVRDRRRRRRGMGRAGRPRGRRAGDRAGAHAGADGDRGVGGDGGPVRPPASSSAATWGRAGSSRCRCLRSRSPGCSAGASAEAN